MTRYSHLGRTGARETPTEAADEAEREPSWHCGLVARDAGTSLSDATPLR
jgi:hypothetical protein